MGKNLLAFRETHHGMKISPRSMVDVEGKSIYYALQPTKDQGKRYDSIVLTLSSRKTV